MAESVIDVIERFLGVDINVKTVKTLSKLSNKQAVELHDRIKLYYAMEYYFVDREKFPEFEVKLGM